MTQRKGEAKGGGICPQVPLGPRKWVTCLCTYLDQAPAQLSRAASHSVPSRCGCSQECPLQEVQGHPTAEDGGGSTWQS